MKSNIYYPATEINGRLPANFTPRGQCDCDCDCACASSVAPAYLEGSSSALWRKAEGLRSLPLSSEYTMFFSPQRNAWAVLNSSAHMILSSFISPRVLQTFGMAAHLAALGLLVPAEGDCACSSNKGACGTTGAPGPLLVAWLHLTDRCNLRCSYCYLPHVREDMSLETGRAAIDATFRSAIAHGFRQVKLKYAGGEPLLQFSLLVELHRYARSLAEEHGLGLEGVVLSNGTLLTAEMLAALKSLDLRLMISLDGLDGYHDAHRSYAGGRGSFQDVAEAVELALAHGLTPNISITVSSRTAGGLPGVMAWILEHDLPFGLNFYRENEFSVSHTDMDLDEQKIVDGMLAAFKVIENNLPKRAFLGGIVDRANLSTAHLYTCGVGQNYLVFDQNGQVAKCQMQIHKPVANAYTADPLAVLRADQSGIQNVSVGEKEGCKTCDWQHWCAGGCPLAAYRETGRYDVKSPNCRIYQALFPEALRLEGLRLLKYQDDPEVVVRC